jgi:hypothetical protein
VTDGRVTEIDVFGVAQPTVERLRALDGVTAVTLEEHDQKQVLVVQTSTERELTAAMLGELDGVAVGRDLARASRRSRTRTSRSSRRRRPPDVRVDPQRLRDEREDATRLGCFLLTSPCPAGDLRDDRLLHVRVGGRRGTLLYAALGAGMMGIWSSTLFGSGGAMQWQRWQGTLELRVAAPPPLRLVLPPVSLANSFVGAYSLVADAALGTRSSSTCRSTSRHPAALRARACRSAVLSLGPAGAS